MMPTRTAFAVLLALAAFSPRVGLADPPPSQFAIEFDGNAAIWNPWGDFQTCETVSESGLTVTLCLSVDDLVCDGTGRCSCDASFDFSGAINGSLTGPCTARVNCIATSNPNDNVCSAIGTKLLIPSAVGSIESCDASIRLVTSGPVDSTGLYRGGARARVCVDCGGGRQCSRISGDFEYALNPPTDWTLTVDQQPTAENPLRLEGAAFDSLGFTYSVVGTRSVGNGVSTFVLRGDDETASEGARIKLRNLVFQGDDLQAGTAKIKVQGNKIREKLGH